MSLFSPPDAHAWKSSLSALPGIGASVFSTFGCPACWTAVAGLLSALGLGFVARGRALIVFTALLLLASLLSLAFRARRRRGYRPLMVGIAAAVLVLFAKFVSGSISLMYPGAGLLMFASVWNAWRIRQQPGPCPRCAALVQLQRASDRWSS